jgi:hypothetical protein
MRLLSESNVHQRSTNYSNIGVTQGIAYVDFGFIEPALVGAIATTAKNGQTTPMILMGNLLRVRRWA